MNRRRGRGALAAALVALAVASGAARGDRLHLDGGGMIETDSWWFDGEMLVYANAEGTVGIARSLVLSIERTPPSGRPAPAAGDEGSGPAAGSVTVPVAVARLLQQGEDALRLRDYERAIDRYARALEVADPELQHPRVGSALALLAVGESERALAIVLDGLARDPHEPALLELLGDIRTRQELVPDALRAWRAAFERAPSDRLREKIETAERELHAGRDYELAMTAHFNLRYDGDVDGPLARSVIDHLERQYWRVAEALDHAPQQPVPVVLYPQREFRDVTRSPEWVGGIYDGKIRVPLGGLRRLDPRASALLDHELTHAIVHAKTRGNCPRWLHEGLAQRFEGKPLTRADHELVARRLARDDPQRWDAEEFSYPLALALTGHLESRGGLHRIVDLLEHLGQGTELDVALGQVYGLDYARLCREWRDAALASSTE